MMRCLSVLVALVAILVGLPMYMWPYVCCERHQLQGLPQGHGDPCASTGRGVAADLQERGFAYLPNVLSEEDIEALLRTQEQVAFNALPGFRTAASMPLAKVLPARVMSMVQGFVDDIEAGSDVKIGKKIPEAFGRAEFMVTDSAEKENHKTTSFPWHQDHGFYWESGEPRSLGLYFMLRKPSRTEAGIMIVPMDRLRLQSPSFYEIAKNSSGSWFSPIPGFPGTMLADMKGTRSDQMHAINFTLDDIACTPESGPGDLLILRGDIPHRTQPHKSFRMSVNMRIARPEYPLTHMLSGSFAKANFLMQAEDYFVARAIRHHLGLTSGAHCGGPQFCEYSQPESESMKLAVKAMDGGVRALIRANLMVRGGLYYLRFVLGHHVLNEEMWPWTIPPAPMDR